MVSPIVKPDIPYCGEILNGLLPGKMVRIQGITHPESDRFNINLQVGPNSKPRDDTALHISVRLNQGYIARNSYLNESWGEEDGSGSLPIGPAQSFEIIILVDPNHYKVAINGSHYCEFPHRIPYEKVSYLLIDGDVTVTLISWEGSTAPLNDPETMTQLSSVNAVGSSDPSANQYGPSSNQYGPPPNQYGPSGPYGPPQGNYGQGFGMQPGYGAPPPGVQHEDSGFWSQAQDVLTAAIASGAAEKLLSGLLSSGNSQQPQGYAPQNAQYGQYPHPSQQDQKGPVESLLSGLLSSAAPQQREQQQPFMPQLGGQGSVGGLGSMGSILSSLAGSVLRNPNTQH